MGATSVVVGAAVMGALYGVAGTAAMSAAGGATGAAAMGDAGAAADAVFATPFAYVEHGAKGRKPPVIWGIS